MCICLLLLHSLLAVPQPVVVPSAPANVWLGPGEVKGGHAVIDDEGVRLAGNSIQLISDDIKIWGKTGSSSTLQLLDIDIVAMDTATKAAFRAALRI